MAPKTKVVQKKKKVRSTRIVALANLIVDKQKKGEKITLKEAMLKVGYSQASATNPNQFTQSSTYQDILKEAGLDDKTMARKHATLFNSRTLKTYENATILSEMTEKEIKEMIEVRPGVTVHKIIYRPQYVPQEPYAKKKKVVEEPPLVPYAVLYYEPNETIQENMLKLAYQVTGKIVQKHAVLGNITNTFVLEDKRKASLDAILESNK